jgi:hypothetical protein
MIAVAVLRKLEHAVGKKQSGGLHGEAVRHIRQGSARDKDAPRVRRAALQRSFQALKSGRVGAPARQGRAMQGKAAAGFKYRCTLATSHCVSGMYKDRQPLFT